MKTTSASVLREYVLFPGRSLLISKDDNKNLSGFYGISDSLRLKKAKNIDTKSVVSFIVRRLQKTYPIQVQLL